MKIINSSVRIKKRVMLKSVLVALLLSISAMSLAQFAGGDGSAASPWQITRPDHLNNIRDYLGEQHRDKHFIQTSNINLGEAPWNEDEGWIPIGFSAADSFQGTYDGNGYSIANLTINRRSSYQGLFGYISDAAVKNIKLEGVSLRNVDRFSGSLTGRATNSQIKNVNSTGIVSSESTSCGGLIGIITAQTEVVNSWTNIIFRTSSGYCGGFIGIVENSTIRNCYSLGEVVSTGETAQSIAGFVGSKFSGSTIDSYSRSPVTVSQNARHIGGLVGSNGGMGRWPSIVNSYATGRITGGNNNVGGLVGSNMGTVTNSYWDMDTTGLEISAGGFGRTTEQMVYPYAGQTYNQWDFEDIWVSDNTGLINDGYPYLYYQTTIILDKPQVTITIETIEDVNHSVLNWDPIEEAGSYNIYASDIPYAENWGEPISITTENYYSQPVGQNHTLFFYVIASVEPAP